MESRSAEPLHGRNNSRHRSGTNNNALKKKKKRRRRAKRTPKNGSVSEPSTTTVAPVSGGVGRDDIATPRRGPPTPVLRPVGAQVPRAPENSTQFIMDDHENSTLFLNFDKSTHEQEPGGSGEEGWLTPTHGTPTHAPTRDWYPFNQADFDAAYRSAREDRLMGGTRHDLCAAIVSLEARAAVLTDALAASPSRLVATLQAQLLHLQEENSHLRQRLARTHHDHSSSSSSTQSDSESDSTNSSSDCSESDCDTCAERRRVIMAKEEEKENTHPLALGQAPG